MFKNGKYRQAALAYERVVFEHTAEPTLQWQAYLKKAWSLKQLQHYKEAQQTLERVDLYAFAGEDSLKEALQYELLLATYLAGDYVQANGYATRFFANNSQSPFAVQSYLLQVFALNRLGKWNEAYQVAQQLQTLLPTQPLFLDSVYAFRTKFKLKKPKKAAMLSTFIPGMGQLYAGYPLKAATSVALHGAALTFGVLSVLDKYYLSGFLTGAGLLQAFYFGGIKHSSYLAEKKNKKKIERHSQRIQGYLLENISQ